MCEGESLLDRPVWRSSELSVTTYYAFLPEFSRSAERKGRPRRFDGTPQRVFVVPIRKSSLGNIEGSRHPYFEEFAGTSFAEAWLPEGSLGGRLLIRAAGGLRMNSSTNAVRIPSPHTVAAATRKEVVIKHVLR